MGRLIRYLDPWLTVMLVVLSIAAYKMRGIEDQQECPPDRNKGIQRQTEVVLIMPVRVLSNPEFKKAVINGAIRQRVRRMWDRFRK